MRNDHPVHAQRGLLRGKKLSETSIWRGRNTHALAQTAPTSTMSRTRDRRATHQVKVNTVAPARNPAEAGERTEEMRIVAERAV